jgi:hypothetical protein
MLSFRKKLNFHFWLLFARSFFKIFNFSLILKILNKHILVQTAPRSASSTYSGNGYIQAYIYIIYIYICTGWGSQLWTKVVFLNVHIGLHDFLKLMVALNSSTLIGVCWAVGYPSIQFKLIFLSGGSPAAVEWAGSSADVPILPLASPIPWWRRDTEQTNWHEASPGISPEKRSR